MKEKIFILQIFLEDRADTKKSLSMYVQQSGNAAGHSTAITED